MLTQERLKELVSYNPETGEFTRLKTSNRGRWKAGQHTGCISTGTGYVMIWLEGKLWTAHRLAWLYIHGSWPSEEIDHINRIRNDNRICNLRQATRKENAANTKTWSSSGRKGVSWDKSRGKWSAKITVNKKTINLGCFDCPELAAQEYVRAAISIRGEFANIA